MLSMAADSGSSNTRGERRMLRVCAGEGSRSGVHELVVEWAAGAIRIQNSSMRPRHDNDVMDVEDVGCTCGGSCAGQPQGVPHMCGELGTVQVLG